MKNRLDFKYCRAARKRRDKAMYEACSLMGKAKEIVEQSLDEWANQQWDEYHANGIGESVRYVYQSDLAKVYVLSNPSAHDSLGEALMRRREEILAQCALPRVISTAWEGALERQKQEGFDQRQKDRLKWVFPTEEEAAALLDKMATGWQPKGGPDGTDNTES